MVAVSQRVWPGVVPSALEEVPSWHPFNISNSSIRQQIRYIREDKRTNDVVKAPSVTEASDSFGRPSVAIGAGFVAKGTVGDVAATSSNRESGECVGTGFSAGSKGVKLDLVLLARFRSCRLCFTLLRWLSCHIPLNFGSQSGPYAASDALSCNLMSRFRRVESRPANCVTFCSLIECTGGTGWADAVGRSLDSLYSSSDCTIHGGTAPEWIFRTWSPHATGAICCSPWPMARSVNR